MRAPRSRDTLLGRVHVQVSLERAHDAEGLYRLVDPRLRARRERERDDEPALTLAELRAFLAGIASATVEEVRIVEARRHCSRHQGRPAALVHTRVRYNGEATPRESRTAWVQEAGVWYSTRPAGEPQ